MLLLVNVSVLLRFFMRSLLLVFYLNFFLFSQVAALNENKNKNQKKKKGCTIRFFHLSLVLCNVVQATSFLTEWSSFIILFVSFSFLFCWKNSNAKISLDVLGLFVLLCHELRLGFFFVFFYNDIF